jgi:hypothetical protein
VAHDGIERRHLLMGIVVLYGFLVGHVTRILVIYYQFCDVSHVQKRQVLTLVVYLGYLELVVADGVFV